MRTHHAIRLAAAAALVGAAAAQGQPIDLSSWTQIQYEFNSQPDASWDLQPGNTSVLQSVNADASIFLSDFDAGGQEIQGTWSVETSSDDDFMGFVFGYQDRGQFYLFDWKQRSQSFSGNSAELGMTLKVVNMPPGMDPTDDDLWPSTSGPNVTVLQHNTIPWDEFTDYDFTLSWVPGTIEITVMEGAIVLESWVVSDSTFTSGEFGFYNYSQGDVLYQGFTRQGVPDTYCTAKLNSESCLPVVGFTGYASMTDPASFDIEATMLINNSFGVLMYGLGGRADVPFGGGTLCIEGPRMHLPVQSTMGNPGAPDCSGSLSVDFNAFLQGGSSTLMAGTQVNAQFFYRDANHLDGTGYGLSDGIEFMILP